jgi:LysM repeat protein
MEEIDPQRYVLPALLAVLFMGAFLILVTSGGSDEPTDTVDHPARSSTTPKRPKSVARPATSTRTASPTPNAGKRFVKVQAGDTPTSIAEAAGITAERLLELNPSVDPGSLKPGQTLKLAP